MSRPRRSLLAALGAAAIALLAAVPAQGEPGDPLFLYVPVAKPPQAPFGGFQPPPGPPPTGSLNGPCGLGVDSTGRLYVSDHYHDTVDVFSIGKSDIWIPSLWRPSYSGQLDKGPLKDRPLDGPCGLAFDADNNLYVNNYHGNVAKFGAFPSFGAGALLPGPTEDAAHHLPTGVAVDPSSGNVYVDRRTYVAVYDSAGAPVLDGDGEPLRIGLGNLGDGYGLALGPRPDATLGRVYVPDAADGTVKVYDPAVDTVDPVATIDGHETANGGFVSLRDSAVAVDRFSGQIYVADHLQPQFAEQPQTAIQVFGPGGHYEGHLKHYVSSASPPGLAVDNSSNLATQGNVYVTSGNTTEAGVYGYERGAATTAIPLPGWPLGGCQGIPTCAETTGGSSATGGAFGAFLPAAVAATEAPSATAGAAAPAAVAARTSQKGSLRLALDSKFSPRSLPRSGAAPIAASVDWRIATTDGSAVPVLKQLRIEINRHGRFDRVGLPTCPFERIQPASSSRALAACRSALVGKGSFTANVALEGQEAYGAQGRLLVFNGRRHGKPVLLGQIYSPYPFPTSFVIVFTVARLSRGPFGTALTATLPKALASWGNLTGIEMTLSRRYSYRGRRHSYISAGCPAPEGFTKATFPLARASFSFRGAARLSSTFVSTCRAQG